MELEELLRRNLINKSIYHPVYGEIGEIRDLIKHRHNKYVVFRERSVANLTEDQDILRAIPASLFYIHDKTNELRVNFGPQWIMEAPKFAPSDLNDNCEEVVSVLNEYYRNNMLWQGGNVVEKR